AGGLHVARGLRRSRAVRIQPARAEAAGDCRRALAVRHRSEPAERAGRVGQDGAGGEEVRWGALSGTATLQMPLPSLSNARAPLTREVDAVNEKGETQPLSIPAERDLTIYVDKRELVTLMTLGAHPE